MNWMFDARLKIAAPPNTDGVSARVPAAHFEDIIKECSLYQSTVLQHLAILSFACNPDWSQILPSDPLQVTGLVVNKNAVRKDVLAVWLVHKRLEIKWRPIVGRQWPQGSEYTRRGLPQGERASLLAARAARDCCVTNLRVGPQRSASLQNKASGVPTTVRQKDNFCTPKRSHGIIKGIEWYESRLKGICRQQSRRTRMDHAGNGTLRIKSEHETAGKAGQSLDQTENKSYHQCTLRKDRVI